MLDRLTHDIIKLKDPNYRWIGALYKKGKKVVKFITNHNVATSFSTITPSWSYMSLQRPELPHLHVSFSSVGVSVVPMCPRPADGHLNSPDQPFISA
jgi:hypothetical protein